MKKIFKKTLSILLRVGISVLLLSFLFSRVDERVMLETVKQADKRLLLLAFAVFSFTYTLCLWRWNMLLRASGVKLPLKRVMISFAGGAFFNLFLPSSIGGDFMRSVDLSVCTKKPRQVVATVLLDRLSGFIGVVVLTLVALSIGWKAVYDRSIIVSIMILTGLLAVILLVLFNKAVYARINRLLAPKSRGKDAPLTGIGKLRDAIKKLHDEIHNFSSNRRVIALNIVVSIIVQCVTPLTFYLISKAFGLDVDFVYFFIFLPIIGAVTMLPISIGGLGLRDAMTVFFFTKVGVSKDIAFAMSLLSFVFIVIYGSIGGLIYVFTLHHRRIQYHKSPVVCQDPQKVG